MKKSEGGGGNEFSSEFYHGMSDTKVEGSNTFRLEIGALLELLQPLLAPEFATLELIEAKKMFEILLKDVDAIDETKDPAQRELMEFRMKIILRSMRTYLQKVRDVYRQKNGREIMELRPMLDQEHATTIIPPDWGDFDKPHH